MVDPQLAVSQARTMTSQREASISELSVRAAAALFSVFGVLALLLATIGGCGPAILAVAASVLSTAAMRACYLPARRATRIVPLGVLRRE